MRSWHPRASRPSLDADFVAYLTFFPQRGKPGRGSECLTRARTQSSSSRIDRDPALRWRKCRHDHGRAVRGRTDPDHPLGRDRPSGQNRHYRTRAPRDSAQSRPIEHAAASPRHSVSSVAVRIVGRGPYRWSRSESITDSISGGHSPRQTAIILRGA